MVNGKLLRAIGMGLGLYGAALGVACAQESESGWYFGASGGQSTFDISKEELDQFVIDNFASAGLVVLSGSSSLDDSDTAWSLFGGYRFSQHFAIEAGYQDLGAGVYRSSGTVGVPGFPDAFPAAVSFDAESSGFTAAGVGAIPLGESFDLHGRLGLFFADSELTESGSTTGFSASETYSETTQEVFYGVGAAFHFANAWTISLDYQLFTDVGDEEIPETDVDVLALSVSCRL